MADLVIRGMEKPIDCHSCWMRVYCFERGIGVWGCGKGKPCPLIPLPEGHGRLGDLDRLFEVMGQDSDRWIVDEVSMIETDDVLDAIQNAPTIVPAEGGTENGV